MSNHETIRALVLAGRRLNRAINRLPFAYPVAYVYNPLHYARAPYELYLSKYGRGPKRVVFLGMNPGPFGMVQTGVPFGEIDSVRNWLNITGSVGKPLSQHPKRPIEGFACRRSEISGLRLWSLFSQRFQNPENFFAEHFVLNYCPLAFLEETGRNRTPDKLPESERTQLFAACDAHLREAINCLRPEWIVGIGKFAFSRAEVALPPGTAQLALIHHPSPANPAANKNWPNLVTGQLLQQGVWAAKSL
jgi:single-strand selective monofunctional uracil DNA glycosylase